jgi:Beta-galactosidase/beta-glucuronidase
MPYLQECIFSKMMCFMTSATAMAFLVQEEVPLWGGETPANDTIRRIATAQVQTMIAQHYNHPSIVSWGMGNELQGRLPAMQQMIAGLVATARSLDSSRMINYVSNTVAHSFITTLHLCQTPQHSAMPF